LEYFKVSVGSYHCGSFYSESFFGVPYDLALLDLRFGVGRTDYFTDYGQKIAGGTVQTLRLMTFLHETSHFVHDLSLGAAIEADHARDRSYSCLVSILQQIGNKTVECPVIEHTSQLPAHPATANLLRWITVCDKQATSLVGAQAGTDSKADHLSGLALLEGIVATLTSRCLALRAHSPEDLEYLREQREGLHILPETLPPLYTAARRLFDQKLSHRTPGLDYHGDDWPVNYDRSHRVTSDIGFLYLADIALHIPPGSHQLRRIKAGKNVVADFTPVTRFITAIKAILLWGGFPDDSDAEEGYFDRYYRLLFDAFAREKQLNWPTFEETNAAWHDELNTLKQQRREAADGYRFRMISERNASPFGLVAGDPILTCRKNHLPIFHLTPTGFKFVRQITPGTHTYLIPLELPDIPVRDIFNRRLKPWSDAKEETLTETEFANSDLLLQEVVYRALCREIHDSIMYKRQLSCPFAHRGCDVATPTCASLQSLSETPLSGCSLREHLAQDGIDANHIRWS
jgi:hypothetical protein